MVFVSRKRTPFVLRGQQQCAYMKPSDFNVPESANCAVSIHSQNFTAKHQAMVTLSILHFVGLKHCPLRHNTYFVVTLSRQNP